MEKRRIIIQLLQQDMKHGQLLHALRQSGFESELHFLNILGVVAQLMDIPEEKISDTWGNMYIDFMCEAEQYEITVRGENLLPLAENCYLCLLACAEKEKQV